MFDCELDDVLTTLVYGYVEEDWEQIERFLHKGDLGWGEGKSVLCFIPGDGTLVPLGKDFEERLKEMEEVLGDIFEEAYEYLGWFRPIHWTWKGKIVRCFFKNSIKFEKDWTPEKVRIWLERLYNEVCSSLLEEVLIDD